MLALSENRPRLLMTLEALGIALLAMTLNLIGNDRTSLWDRDEPRYAQCTREMRQSGDYLLPTYNGEPRHHKPVLIYWMMAAATSLAGDTPFGARLVSAVAGACSCLVVWRFGGRMIGRGNGLIAALILAISPLTFINSKLATTDAVLALFVLICQLAVWELRERESTLSSAIFWASLALATLTKGPIAILLIAAAGLCTRIAAGPSACWSRLKWSWGISLFALIAGPWYVAIGVATRGEFFRFAVHTQIVQRITSEMEQHGGFPGYYPVTLLLTFYPWSALLPASVLLAWARRKSNPRLGFLLGWMIGPMIALECARTKLVHYYLPAIPACAMLVAYLIEALTTAEINLRRWPLGRLAMGILAGVGIGLTVTMVALAIILPGPVKWACLTMAVALTAGTLVAVDRLHNGKSYHATFLLLGTWSLMLMMMGGWFLPALEPYRLSKIVANRLTDVARDEGADPILAMYKEPSIIYAIGHPIEILVDRPTLLDRMRRRGPVVTAFTDKELAFMKKDPRFTIEHRERIHGIDLSKSPKETLNLVVLRPNMEIADRRKQNAKAPSDPQVRRMSLERQW